MKKDVIIIGASGHAKVIADIVKKSGDNLIGFLDDNKSIYDKAIFDSKKVLGTVTKTNLEKYKDCYFIIGIGNNKSRKSMAKKFLNLKWYTAIHPSAIIGNEVTIDEGTAIMAGVVINPGTKIGKHCIINTSSSLDHDNLIEDYVHISPGSHLAGSVTIKEGTWICTGVTVINNITIEKNNVIGAGGVVVKDITTKDNTYLAGTIVLKSNNKQ